MTDEEAAEIEREQKSTKKVAPSAPPSSEPTTSTAQENGIESAPEEDKDKVCELLLATTWSFELDSPYQKSDKEAESEEEDDDAKGKLKPNTGNGGDLPNYSWTQVCPSPSLAGITTVYCLLQTLQEVEIRIPSGMAVPIKGRDVVIDFQPKVSLYL